MSLHLVPQKDLRDYCRRLIDTLEIWLRQLIHDKLLEAYGENYLEASDGNGKAILGGKLRVPISERRRKAPKRYPRPIDAAQLEETINILCHPKLFAVHFKVAVKEAYPCGCEQARATLEKLIEPRNRLSHSNVITVRDAERIICYVGDAIDSLKSHYAEIGMAKDYNAPRITRVTDSLGNVRIFSENLQHIDSADFRQSRPLYPGDTISAEVEVDSTFLEEDYHLRWKCMAREIGEGARFSLDLENRHVNATLEIFCELISKRAWHRYGVWDHCIGLFYKILPPKG